MAGVSTPIVSDDLSANNIYVDDIFIGNTTPGNIGGTSVTNFIESCYRIQISQTGINFNVTNTDYTFAITLPPGFTRYMFDAAIISNASHSLSTATCTVNTATGAAGTALVTSATSVTITATADATANNAQILAATTAANDTSFQVVNTPNLYFRVQTSEGAAATATVAIILKLLP
jgi:hypothetical protein